MLYLYLQIFENIALLLDEKKATLGQGAAERLAFSGLMRGPLKPPVYHSIIVLRVLNEPLNGAPITPGDVSLSDSKYESFATGGKFSLKKKSLVPASRVQYFEYLRQVSNIYNPS